MFFINARVSISIDQTRTSSCENIVIDEDFFSYVDHVTFLLMQDNDKVKNHVVSVKDYVRLMAIHYSSLYPTLTKEELKDIITWSVPGVNLGEPSPIRVSRIEDYKPTDLSYEALFMTYLNSPEKWVDQLKVRIGLYWSEMLDVLLTDLYNVILARGVRLLPAGEMSIEKLKDLLKTPSFKSIAEGNADPETVANILNDWLIPSLTNHMTTRNGIEPKMYFIELISKYTELYPLIYNRDTDALLELIKVSNIPLLETRTVLFNDTLLSILILQHFHKTELALKLIQGE